MNLVFKIKSSAATTEARANKEITNKAIYLNKGKQKTKAYIIFVHRTKAQHR